MQELAAPNAMPISIEEAIHRIPRWAGASSLAVTALPGGITNLNYRVVVGGESFVVRIAAPNAAQLGIDRQREYHCTVAASQTGIGPEVVYFLPDVDVLVTRFIDGRCPSVAEMVRPEMMQRLVASMHRYREGPVFEGSFSPFHALTHYRRVARDQGAPLPQDVGPMYRHLAEIEEALRRGRAVIQPCHNDLWEPNLIDDGTVIHIVDWEYAGMGDVHFDLANFAIHHDLTDPQDEELLHSHFGEVTDGGVARLKLMRIVAELREAMWCMVGMNVSSIAFDFLGYAAAHFARYRRALDDRRLSQWLAQAVTGA
ncbi:MAG TPA: choline kinase family protein [bacterium]|nr:choline kinase family protein [bacterium]